MIRAVRETASVVFGDAIHLLRAYKHRESPIVALRLLSCQTRLGMVLEHVAQLKDGQISSLQMSLVVDSPQTLPKENYSFDSSKPLNEGR